MRARARWVSVGLLCGIAAVTIWLARSPLAGRESAAWAGPSTSSDIARCIRDPACHRLFVVAHRAEGFGGVENSRAAVSRAVASGTPVIEIDLRESRDGVLFVIHDSRLDLTTSGRGRVEETSAEAMARARLQNGEAISRFEDVYAITRGRAVLSVDFKATAEAMERTVNWIAAHGSFDDLIFFANTGEEIRVVARARQRHPGMITMVRLLDTRVTVDSTRTEFGGRLPDIFHTERVGADDVAGLHGLGVKVYMNALPIERYYQPFKFLAMRRLLGTGVDFVLTGEAASLLGAGARPR
jgi:hypothetical protein